MSDAIETIHRLKRLRDEGAISDEQYETQREAALSRAARSGTAPARPARGSSAVIVMTLIAIIASLGALVLTLAHRRAPATAAGQHLAHRLAPTTAQRGSIGLGMSTWDGTQSMSAAGSQDMTPPDPAAAADASVERPGTPVPIPVPVVESVTVQVVSPAQAQTSASPPAQPAPSDPAAPQDVRASAPDLSQAFQVNAAATEGHLAGRRIIVTGTLDKTSLDVPDYPSISLEGSDPQHDVGANLERTQAERAARLNPGERVTVTCQSVADLAGIPVLDHCTL